MDNNQVKGSLVLHIHSCLSGLIHFVSTQRCQVKKTLLDEQVVGGGEGIQYLLFVKGLSFFNVGKFLYQRFE